MTRINLGISQLALVDSHALAEWRELPRIPSELIKRYISTGRIPDIPNVFQLGTGHVKFFYDKNMYLARRYIHLTEELQKRNFDINPDIYATVINNFTIIKNHGKYWKDIHSSVVNKGKVLLNQRLSERLHEMDRLHYYGNSITLQQALQLLKDY